MADNMERASIIEHSHILDLLKYIAKDSYPVETIAVFDMDSTLVKPTKHLGTTHWWNHHVTLKTNSGIQRETAMREVIELWRKLQPHLSLTTVEEHTLSVLKEVQLNTQYTFMLTSRNPRIAQVSFEQLKGCGISFSDSGFEKDFTIDTSDASYHYEDGAVFCGSYEKGKALVEILIQLNYRPQRIVFIDDDRQHVENVKQAVSAFDNSIEYFGIRYGHLDNFPFDPECAQKEFEEIKEKL